MFSAMSAPKLWGCHQRWKTDPEIAACRIARQIRLSLISSSDFRPGLYGRRKRLERTFINGSPLQGSTALLPESGRSEEHTSELPSLMTHPYTVLCLKKKH